MSFRIEGYVIVSADGMLADADHVMPDSLKFEGDKRFFESALDRAALIVHGRHSHEQQPNSPKRRRLILTRKIPSLAVDPELPNASLWNPLGTSFEEAADFAGVTSGTVAVIGGPVVFDMFMDRYDTFWLSEAPHVRLPGGEGCFTEVPARTPYEVLSSHGLKADAPQMLDAADGVIVTPWRRG
ncbi:dihydrofolate reductase [Bradyrhizobium manausense]|uniref:dihydrofolate reductase n=1 Tax=Bradyrhizobium TaxID=374 RepID=UPI001BACC086|nr:MULTISPECIES: dihydrofolate reductase [Bradyrhizobium]MBR0828034.1 dihydrofolate reductase [Bradyrhizobium manausense]UVO32896.1 dihydrofolate reductase [Bradyrhizobium arachidis]